MYLDNVNGGLPGGRRMNRIDMLRVWHKDGCNTTAHARAVRSDQTWILYTIYDPKSTINYGYHFALTVVFDNRTGHALGFEVRSLQDTGGVRWAVGSTKCAKPSQSILDWFEGLVKSGCDFNPDDSANVAVTI